MRAPITALVLLVATLVSAQGGASLRGTVRRELSWGCGQMWSSHVARSDVTLEITGGRARLHIDAHVVDASGGVDDGAAHHDQQERALTIDWRGRVRRVHGALVIELSTVTEAMPVAGSPIAVTSRSTVTARLTCTRAVHDVMPSSRPIVREGEPATAQRPITTCVFDRVERDGALPRPVLDVLSTPFFLDEGAGITTDAIYRGGVTAVPDELVAREPDQTVP